MNIRYPAPDPPPRSARRPAQYFERAAYAQALASLGNKSISEIVEERWPDDAATMRLVTRAASSPASRGTPAWAGSLALDAVGDFVATLAPQSAVARLVNAGMKMDLTGRNSLKVPRRDAVPATNIPWVPESGAIPIKTYTLSATQLGPALKLACGCVLTREVAIHSSGQQTIATLLREDLAGTLDAAVLGTAAAVAGTNPAGLTNGLTPLTGTTGGNDDAMKRDLEKLAGQIFDAGGGSVVYIMAPRQAMAAKLRLLAQDITIWPSIGLAAGTVVCIEPNAFCSFISPVFDVATDGAVHLANPAAELVTSGGTVATPIQSLFQSDLVAIRAMIEIAYCMRASNMVAVVTGATWGAAT